jgi:hypothetical protein
MYNLIKKRQKMIDFMHYIAGIFLATLVVLVIVMIAKMTP